MIRVSGRTIQRWVDKFPKLIEAFARKLKAECGDAATVDEKFFSSKGKGRWFFYTRDMKNRFILSSETAADKLNFVADHLFANMLKRLGKRPRFLLSDRLKGFREAFDKLLYTEPELESIQSANLALKGKHVDNNQHERQNGSLDEFLHGRRAFNSDHPGLFRLCRIPQLFAAPHGAGRQDPRRSGGHCCAGARYVAHADTGGGSLAVYVRLTSNYDRLAGDAADGAVFAMVVPDLCKFNL